ncbi:hypothetical protein [Sulfurimonas sp.]|uniref:hypothetical protein n=1 Tax=Sulfurimonas sp. TaxID=2022749 RepID=UPI00356596DD
MIKLEVYKDGVKTLIDRDLVPKDADGREFDYILSTMTSGIYDVDTTRQGLADKEVARVNAKTTRDNYLQAITHTLADGAIVQVRPQDVMNFEMAISLGVSKDWVLKNNTIRTLTVAEMQECLNSGIAQAENIWTTYTDFLKAQ